jgi:hypothetical protein
MAPGERLAGWRFATGEEVQKFFANFTGSGCLLSPPPCFFDERIGFRLAG